MTWLCEGALQSFGTLLSASTALVWCLWYEETFIQLKYLAQRISVAWEMTGLYEISRHVLVKWELIFQKCGIHMSH